MKKYRSLLIDILTPKQALFMGELAKRLRDNGYAVHVTSRKFSETIQMLERTNMSAEIIGEYGKNIDEKLFRSLDRASKLAILLREWKIDLAISFSSVETARASFGLSIPHLCVSDSPHAKAVSRLTIPLSEKLFTPKIIPKQAWFSYGIHPKNIIQYNALDPVVWIKDNEPRQDDLAPLGLDLNKKILVIRLEETFASYLLNREDNRPSVITKVVRRVLEEDCDAQIVILPRYKELFVSLKEEFMEKVIIPSSVIYAPSLLPFSDVFLGGGGTMTAEAALLGIPTISCFPGDSTYVARFLTKHELLKHSIDVEKIVNWIFEALSGKVPNERLRRTATNLINKMEDPLEVIINEIERKNRS